MANFALNKIIFIESLTGSHKQTSKDIYNYSVLNNVDDPIDGSEYIEVNNKEDLLNSFNEIIRQIEEEGVLPYIHFETHGLKDKSGLELNDGEIKWDEFVEGLKKINIACKNNLFTSFGVCFGAYVMQYLLLEFYNNTDCRVPVFGFIAPINEVPVDIVDKAFRSYFKSLLLGKDICYAIEEMNKAINDNYEWAFSNCEEIYQKMAENFVFKYIDKRRKYIASNPNKYFNLLNYIYHFTYEKDIEISKLLSVINEKNFFIDYLQKKRDTFYMIDLFPENKERFTRYIKDLPGFEKSIIEFHTKQISTSKKHVTNADFREFC